jgi:transposase
MGYLPVGSTAMANASEGGSSVVERCAGLDWAKEEHRVCILDADGRFLLERGVIHDERGIASVCALLVELGVRRIAIERPNGLLVERLLEAGLVVLAIHPKAS